MSDQRSERNLNGFTQFRLNDFLNNLNHNIVYLPPFNDPNTVAVHARNSAGIQILNGKDLLKWNIKREAQRLQLQDERVINLATNRVWEIKFTSSQKQQFNNLANNANTINQNIRRAIDDTLNMITKINTPQETTNILEDGFYNGTKFSDNDDLESLILSDGFSVNLRWLESTSDMFSII